MFLNRKKLMDVMRNIAQGVLSSSSTYPKDKGKHGFVTLALFVGVISLIRRLQSQAAQTFGPKHPFPLACMGRLKKHSHGYEMINYVFAHLSYLAISDLLNFTYLEETIEDLIQHSQEK